MFLYRTNSNKAQGAGSAVHNETGSSRGSRLPGSGSRVRRYRNSRTGNHVVPGKHALSTFGALSREQSWQRITANVIYGLSHRWKITASSAYSNRPRFMDSWRTWDGCGHKCEFQSKFSSAKIVLLSVLAAFCCNMCRNGHIVQLAWIPRRWF